MGRSFRERILRTYRREPIKRVVFQPRIMYWFNGNKVMVPKERHESQLHDASIPEAFFGLDALEMHQELDVSIRYAAETLGLGMFSTHLKKGAKSHFKAYTEKDTGVHVQTLVTPLGKLEQKSRDGYTMEKFVKHPEDLEVMKFMIGEQEFLFNKYGFDLAEEIFEDTGLGVAQSYYQRSPFMRCILNYLGFETTVLFLVRYRKQMADFMNFMEECDDQMYDVICDSPMQILNFGENIDGNLISPRYFKKYLVPYWEKRVKQIHDAGKFCHAHFDGALKDLLPLIKLTSFDGIEAATPLPQGDVTEYEIKEGLGDKILLDGIPATLCMPHFPIHRLEENVKLLLELFNQNIILGISDELPPNAEITRFSRVKKIVNDFIPSKA